MVRKAQPARPHKRAGIWYLIRRVPKQFEALDRRGLVRLSTNIAVADDPRGTHALRVVRQLDGELEAYWRGLSDGRDGEARRRFDEAQRRARSLNLTYRTNQELAEGPLDEIRRRLDVLVSRGVLDDEREVAAVMGGEQRPEIRISDVLGEVEKMQADVLRAKSPQQIKKWRDAKQLVLGDFAGLVGDKDLVSLTRDDALAYRRWWQAKTAAGQSVATANRNISTLSKLLKIVNMAYQLELKPLFANLLIEGQVDAQRAAFPAAWVQDRIFATGALDGLNDQARHLIYLLAETGMRPSEAANLCRDDIVLDANIPHIRLRPGARSLKTADSARDIPLVGAALAVMALHPDGFPRFRDKANMTQAIKVRMATHGLLPTPAHSLYGLRHSFEDRLTAVEAPEKVVATLMGHKWHRPKYGAGPSLEQKQRWLQAIAFKPPKHF